jgi:hypothetical protein
LSNRIIGDLDSTAKMPYSEDFEDKSAIAVLDSEIEKLNLELENLRSKEATVEKTIATAKDNHANEKQSFDNWLETRRTLGLPDKDKAEKALENHFCPLCGKDFLLRKWEFPVTKAAEADTYKFVTTFCRHCGLELFKNCSNCGTKNFAHLLFCSSCGTKIDTTNEKTNS